MNFLRAATACGAVSLALLQQGPLGCHAHAAPATTSAAWHIQQQAQPYYSTYGGGQIVGPNDGYGYNNHDGGKKVYKKAIYVHGMTGR